MLDLIVAILQQEGLTADDFEPEFAPARLGEIERSCLDVTRARDELGCEAATGLVGGMEPTLAWARGA